MRGGVAYGVGSGALWGLVFLAPAVIPDFTTIELSAGRYLAYGIVSLLAVLISGRASALALLRKVRAEHWWLAARLALIGNLVYYALLSAAVQAVGVAATSLIIGTLPVTITLLGSRGRDIASPADRPAAQSSTIARLAQPRLRDLAPALLLILLGIACVNADVFSWHGATEIGGGGDDADRRQALLGVAAALGALAAWTWYAVGNARGLEAHPTFSNAEWSVLQGLVSGVMALVIWGVLLALPLPLGNALGSRHAPVDRQIVFWAVNIALALGASWLGNTLWNAAARRLPLTLSGQMIVFETLFALLYGFVHAQRFPRPLEGAAILLLGVGVMWSVRLHAPAPRQSAAPTGADR
ncbi:EamA family transporter [Robbsia sp. KACC 23696]|uniref:EamA family transporter n=1 Tax=Robbsia sp. KACC 23696 TaxID=3149231 RepID=UPI00325A8FC2